MNLLIILGMKKLLKSSKISKLLFKYINRGGLILPLILLFSSCGISSYIYIYPPIAGSNLSFSHDYRNNKDPNYITLGYDIYYRIYDNSDTDNSKFYNKTGSEVTNILVKDGNDFFTSGNINKLISRNFNDDSLYRPIKHFSNDKEATYSPPPILPVDNSVISNKTFLVNILLDNTRLKEPYLETVAPYDSKTLPEIIYFQRYLSNTENKTFTSFSVTDSDVPETLTDYNILVAFFVISYGLTVDQYSLTSDKPLFIGSTNLIGD